MKTTFQKKYNGKFYTIEVHYSVPDETYTCGGKWQIDDASIIDPVDISDDEETEVLDSITDDEWDDWCSEQEGFDRAWERGYDI